MQVAGQEVCILGRGTTLGRPLALLLTQKRPTANAAVTVVHTGVPDWAAYTRRAAIVVAAVGVPGILQPEHITPGATVVGGGVRYEGRRLLPDVDEACNEVAGAITPRVGGVGPTTVAMLFKNCVEAAERRAGARRSCAGRPASRSARDRRTATAALRSGARGVRRQPARRMLASTSAGRGRTTPLLMTSLASRARRLTPSGILNFT